MADAKHVEGIVDQVIATLDEASPEVIYLLTKKLIKDRVTRQEYQIASIADNEFECPHCFKTMETEQVYIIETGWFENEPYEADFNEEDDDSGGDYLEGGTLRYDEDVHHEADDVGFECAYCHLPFALPSGWDKEWV
jgi:hypothetical protein